MAIHNLNNLTGASRIWTWKLSRSQLRAIARYHNLKPGRNRADTERALVDAGIMVLISYADTPGIPYIEPSNIPGHILTSPPRS